MGCSCCWACKSYWNSVGVQPYFCWYSWKTRRISAYYGYGRMNSTLSFLCYNPFLLEFLWPDGVSLFYAAYSSQYYLIMWYLISSCIVKLSYRIFWEKNLEEIEIPVMSFHFISSPIMIKWNNLRPGIVCLSNLQPSSRFAERSCPVSYFGWSIILLMKLIQNWFKIILKFSDKSENWMAVLQAPIICLESQILVQPSSVPKTIFCPGIKHEPWSWRGSTLSSDLNSNDRSSNRIQKTQRPCLFTQTQIHSSCEGLSSWQIISTSATDYGSLANLISQEYVTTPCLSACRPLLLRCAQPRRCRM